MILTDYFQLVIIELSKAKKEYEKNKENGMLQWMMFLDNPESMEVKEIMEKNEEIKEAKNELNRLSQDEILRRQLLKEKLLRMDMKQIEEDAREDGLLEGEKKGKKEEKIAKRMLEKNIPIETIMEITELKEEDIKKLMESN